mmetsp:Transcript_47590/g.126180  ORF Transcript_47590/g.126180 Transcript_47590/m.126180 type:complete len:237 (-) Transcript_47590:572-1282(-)
MRTLPEQHPLVAEIQLGLLDGVLRVHAAALEKVHREPGSRGQDYNRHEHDDHQNRHWEAGAVQLHRPNPATILSQIRTVLVDTNGAVPEWQRCHRPGWKRRPVERVVTVVRILEIIRVIAVSGEVVERLGHDLRCPGRVAAHDADNGVGIERPPLADSNLVRGPRVDGTEEEAVDQFAGEDKGIDVGVVVDYRDSSSKHRQHGQASRHYCRMGHVDDGLGTCEIDNAAYEIRLAVA